MNTCEWLNGQNQWTEYVDIENLKCVWQYVCDENGLFWMNMESL